MGDFPAKVISVRQPWASLILNGVIPIWNIKRKFKVYNDLKGQRVGICASGTANVVKREIEFADNWLKLRNIRIDWSDHHQVSNVILGTVKFVDVIDRGPRPYFEGPYGLVFQKPKWLDKYQIYNKPLGPAFEWPNRNPTLKNLKDGLPSPSDIGIEPVTSLNINPKVYHDPYIVRLIRLGHHPETIARETGRSVQNIRAIARTIKCVRRDFDPASLRA